MPLPGGNGESDGGSWAMAVAFGSVVVNAIGFIVGWVWTLARTKNSTDEKVAERKGEIAGGLVEMERRLEREFGETVTAIRTKVGQVEDNVRQVELYVRDNFVSKSTFQTVIADMKRSWERFEDDLKESLKDISDKVDQRNKSD